MAKKKTVKTGDDATREFWRVNGGSVHAPSQVILQESTWIMSETKIFPLLKGLRHKPVVSWGPFLPGSKISQARMLILEGQPIGKFERWEEDRSLDSVHSTLLALNRAGAIKYEFLKEEW